MRETRQRDIVRVFDGVLAQARLVLCIVLTFQAVVGYVWIEVAPAQVPSFWRSLALQPVPMLMLIAVIVYPVAVGTIALAIALATRKQMDTASVAWLVPVANYFVYIVALMVLDLLMMRGFTATYEAHMTFHRTWGTHGVHVLLMVELLRTGALVTGHLRTRKRQKAK